MKVTRHVRARLHSSAYKLDLSEVGGCATQTYPHSDAGAAHIIYFTMITVLSELSLMNLVQALLPLLPQLLQQLPSGVFTATSLLLLAYLSPTMWYLWMDLGTGNANFFYAITLLWGAWQVTASSMQNPTTTNNFSTCTVILSSAARWCTLFQYSYCVRHMTAGYFIYVSCNCGLVLQAMLLLQLLSAAVESRVETKPKLQMKEQ